MNRKVSIIVPCYRQANFLPETLDSVLKQTYTEWECIIVNDGSPDNTEDVVNAYVNKDSRFKYLKQENQGISMARNNGIKSCSGEFILPLDSDDILMPTYIEKAMSVFEKDDEVKVVYSRIKYFGKLNKEFVLPKYDYNLLKWQNLIFCSALYRKSDFDKCNGYNPNMKKGLEDWDFWLGFLNKTDKVYQINEILFLYRIKEISRNSKVIDNSQDLYKQIYLNHQELYSEECNEIIYLHNRNLVLTNFQNSFLYRLLKKINTILKR